MVVFSGFCFRWDMQTNEGRNGVVNPVNGTPSPGRHPLLSQIVWLTVIGFGTVAGALPAQGRPVVIDSFAVPVGGQTITRDGIGSASSLYTLGGVGLLGGSRALELTVTADTGSLVNASANGSISDKLVYENGSGIASVLSVSYNANGLGLAQDWSTMHELAFMVDRSDLPGTVKLEFFSSTDFSGASFASRTVNVPHVGLLNTLFNVPFSSFVKSGGFTFADVDSIRITVAGPQSYDMVMHTVVVDAPEAGTVIPLVGFALVGTGWLGVRLRRNREAAAKQA